MRKINILNTEYEKLEIHIPIEKLNGHSLNEVFKDNGYPLTDTDKTDLGIQDLDIYLLNYYHRMFRYLKYEEQETGYIYTDDGASKLDVAKEDETYGELFEIPKIMTKLDGMSFYDNDVLQSVAFDKRIRSVGKNIFDKSKATQGYYIIATTGAL
jgi:hypothetical protein